MLFDRWLSKRGKAIELKRTTKSSRALHFEPLEARSLLSAGIQVSPVRGLQTSEDGGYNIVNVRLTGAPASPVSIQLRSDNPREGLPSVNALMFTPENWTAVQSFRVTGQPDCVRDGKKTYHIITDAALSDDPQYSGMDVPDITLQNHDVRKMRAGIQITPSAGLVTSEAGDTATFSVKLTCKPTSPVTVPIGSSDTSEGIADVSAVTITPEDWNVAHTVTVTGLADDLFDGDVPYRIITGPAQSADPNYNGIDPVDVLLRNRDRADLSRFNGTYSGSYHGTVSGFGFSGPIQGAVQFSVVNGQITVTVPGAGSGVVQTSGSAGFGAAAGAASGASWAGEFKAVIGSNSVCASGGWSVSTGGVFGSGTWSACS